MPKPQLQVSTSNLAHLPEIITTDNNLILVRSDSHRGYYREYKPSRDDPARASIKKPREVVEYVEEINVKPPRKKKQANTTIIREFIEPIYHKDQKNYDNRGYVSV